MKRKLLAQVEALRGNISGRRTCPKETAETLNKIREMILESLPDNERQIMDLIYPLKIHSNFDFVNTIDALRLCGQLIALADQEQVESTQGDLKRVTPHTKNVFIIHGHDTINTVQLCNLLKERYSLDPIVLSEKPGKGRTLIEKFEDEAAMAAFAFALFTPDDMVKDESREYSQARPNVVFEIGWFYGRLGRERVCVLFKEGTKVPSDLDGVSTIQFKESFEEKIVEIEKELRAAGILEN